MSYSKYTWQTGETITAEKLNNLEGGVQEALSGYECIETKNILTEESVTTISQGAMNFGQLSYSQFIDADSLTITIDGTSYEVSKIDMGGGFAYGEVSQSGPDFSKYPFAIISSNTGNRLFTPQEGTYSVKIESLTETITTSEDFEKAVKFFTLKNVADAENKGVVANNINNNTSSGFFAFAEGDGTEASGYASHAEGAALLEQGTGVAVHVTASGYASHAEGSSTTASGGSSHAEGQGTIAKNIAQHAFGMYNVADPSTADGTRRGTYLEIAGNGINSNQRSNARTLDWNGNESLQGSLTLGKGTANETTITAAQLKALIALLNS